MHIERLALSCFGPFDGLELHLPAAAQGPDLHLIVGANEAGKTSLLEALRQLLHGMPSRNPYAFGRDYKLLEIGATLLDGSRKQDIRRLKNALLDADGNRLDESAIDLHGLSAEAVRARFSFDEKTLREGGQAIIEHHGELGAALFSAAAGLADVDAGLRRACATGDAFYDWSKKRKQPLDLLSAELAELEERIERVDLGLPQWRALKQHADSADTQARDCRQALDRLGAERTELARTRDAIADARRVQRFRAALLRIGDVPDLPVALLDGFAADQLSLTDSAARADVLRERRAVLEEERKVAAPDAALLAHEKAIDALASDVAALSESTRLQAAQQAELGELEARLATLKRSAGVDDASDGAPDSALVDRLGELLEEHAELQRTYQACEAELERLAPPDDAAAATEQTDALTASVAELDTLLESLDESAVAHEQQTAAAALDDATVTLNQRIDALTPWAGESGSLATLAVPSTNTLAQLEERVRASRERVATVTERCEEDAARLRSLQKERDTLGREGAIDEQTLLAARRARDQDLDALAAAIEQPVDTVSSRTLEQRLRTSVGTSDALADARHAGATSSTRLQALDDDLAALQLQYEARQADQATAVQAHGEAAEHCTRLLASLGLHSLPFDDLADWRVRHGRALEALDRQRRCAAELTRRDNDCDAARARLSAVLKAHRPVAAGSDTIGLDEALRAARTLRRKLDAERTRQDSATVLRERARSERRDRQGEHQRALDALSAFTERWQSLADGTPLADITLELAELRHAPWSELPGVHERAQALRDSLETIRIETGRCSTTLIALQESARPSAHSGAVDKPPASDVATLRAQTDALNQQLTAARADRTLFERLTRDMAIIDEELERAELDTAPAAARMADLVTRMAGDPSSADMDATVQRVREANSTQAELARAETDLAERLAVEHIEQPLSELLATDTHQLEQRIAQLDSDVASAQTAHQSAREHARDAQLALQGVGDDDELQRLATQRAALLDELREGAEHALRLKLGRTVIEAGIHRFRDQHRSGMLRAAKEVFTHLTRGRFKDLQTRPGEDGREFLFAMTHDGTPLEARQMSEGTSLQLYLALRIAAYEQYAARRTPLPFVADDILQSSDDARAHAVFESFTRMSTHGQVIYLTHHHHLIDIAQRASAGAVQVHHLPDPSRPAAS